MSTEDYRREIEEADRNAAKIAPGWAAFLWAVAFILGMIVGALWGQ